MSNFAVGDLAWIPASCTQARYTIPAKLHYGSSRAAWLPVVIKKIEGNDQLLSTLEWDSNLDIKCKAALVYPRDNAECSLDLSKLRHHNDGSIIHSLGTFYSDMKFSAKIGKYFLCTNPGNRLVDSVGHHHNSAADMLPYFNGDPEACLSVYSAADTAYRKVSECLLNQTIVLRGCSGSGKTEASKHILQYLIFADNPQKVSKSVNYATYTPLGHAHNPFVDVAPSSVSKALAAGSAVLDIFGGAPSGRNPHSSRVIRQTKVAYDLDGRLCGIDFQYHMFDMSCLDMSSIDKIAPYRIFSLLSLGIKQSDPRSGDFKITSSVMDDFRALSDSHEEDAIADFAHLESLLQAVELPAETWRDMQCTLAAVLHLQRLNVSGSDTATISAATKNHVAHAEELLRLEKGTLGPALLKKSMDIGGQQTFKNLSQEDAKLSILALGAFLYEKTFKRLLQHCSQFAAVTEFSSMSGPQLRIIDCCGNENLEHSPNQLSQFLINVAEEKMNEHYMFRAFDREEQLCRSEGVIPPTAGPRDDLGPMAALLDEPPLSIINILEEVTLMQRGSDKALFDKIFNTHSKGKLIKVAGRTANPTCFVIKHTFGDTQYDLDGFTTSNKVAPSPDVKTLITKSLEVNFPFLMNLENGGAEEEEEVSEKPRRMTGRASPAMSSKLNKKNLLANKARKELNDILKSINGSENDGEADPIYIFCLKANNDPQAIHYDPSFIASQIKFFNLSQLSHFCGQGFAKFELFKEFYDRYRLLFPKTFDGLPWKLSDNDDHQSLVKVLLQECAALACEPAMLDDERVIPVFGHTKIFLRDVLIDILEKLRNSTLFKYSQAATLIQSSARAKKVRKETAIYKKGFLQFQAMTRKYLQQKIYSIQIKSIKKIQGYYLMKKFSSHYKNMLAAVEVIKRRFLNKMIVRIRYKRLQRATKSLQFLARGFVVRQHVNHMLRAALLLQNFASDFIKRLRRFYFRKIAVVRIQQVFRGAKCRYENRAAVRVLKKRSNQRIGTKAVLRMQSNWRTKMCRARMKKVIDAAKVIQGWSISRKKRNEFLQIMYLNKWLQCTARRIIATNRTQALQIERMLEIEKELLENARTEEVECLTYHSIPKLTDLRVGAGYSRNGSDKFVRYIIGYDVSFDFSGAYPAGWVQTILDFRKHLTTLGQRRISHIAVGDSHTVLVDSSSNIFCFGLGDYGQLGRADRRNSEVPKQVDALRHSLASSNSKSALNRSLTDSVEVMSIAAGRDHTLALTSTGHIFSWGGNRRGQLGHSNFNSSAIPRLVEGIKNVKTIVTGSYHSCCLADPGVVYTWGARECLGRKAESDECAAKSLPFFSKRRVQLLVSGDAHVVCRSGRKFYSWGSNAFGQLGIGGSKETGAEQEGIGACHSDENTDVNSRNEGKVVDDINGGILGRIFPTAVNIASEGWSEKDFFACHLVAGGRHVLLALRDHVWGWGWNAFGQVGDGTTENVFSPLRIKWAHGGEREERGGSGSGRRDNDNGGGAALAHIAQLTAGWRSSVIITQAGDIYAWGHAGLHGSFVNAYEDTVHPPTSALSVSASTSMIPPPGSDLSSAQPSDSVSTGDGDLKKEKYNASAKIKPALLAVDPGVPLLTPQKVTLPGRLRDQKIVKLYSSYSNAMSLCAIDVLVTDPPKAPLNKSKYVSNRQAEPLKVNDSTTSEFIRLQREQLGSWSNSAKMKNQRAAIKASLTVKEEVVDNFDESIEWGCKDLHLSSRNGSSQSAKFANTQQRQTEEERQALKRDRERREGKVTHDGLLGIFSPVKTSATSSLKLQMGSENQREYVFGDDSSVASSQDDSISESGDFFSNNNNINHSNYSSNNVSTSGVLLPSASKSNMSLTKMAQQRRSSIAAGRQTSSTNTSWHATDRGVAPRRRASKMMITPEEGSRGMVVGRRASVGSIGVGVGGSLPLSRVNSGSIKTLDSKQGKYLARSNKESHEKNSKFNRDLANLNNDIYRKREPKKDRFKATATSDSVNASVGGMRNQPMRRQNSAVDASADTGLSLVAVSDLATMIQSIKEESMQNLSNSWKF